jgi:hypothetical protein
MKAKKSTKMLVAGSAKTRYAKLAKDSCCGGR